MAALQQNMDSITLKRKIILIFKIFNPEKIILFGSFLRGNQDEFSDIDLVIVYKTSKTFLNRLKELYLKWDIPKAVDILAYTPEEFQDMLKENTFIQNIVNTGEILYERS
jgi:predicted nucleotidyltransferase